MQIEPSTLFGPQTFISEGVTVGLPTNVGVLIRPVEKHPLFSTGLTRLKYEHMKAAYIIMNSQTGHYYIGSSVKLFSRLRNHRKDLRNNHHHVKELQLDYNQKGELDFNIAIITADTNGQTRFLEDILLDMYMNDPLCLNVIKSSKAGNFEHGEEIRAKMSEARKKQVITPETIAKMLARRKDHKCSDETREKLRIASTGRRHSDETKARLSMTNKGRKLTEEQYQRRLVQLEINRTDPEIIAKRCKALKGKPINPNTLAALIKANTGRISTEEQRKRISEATKLAMRRPEVKEKVDLARKKRYENYVCSDETRARLSAACKGRELTEKQKATLHDASIKRKKPVVIDGVQYPSSTDAGLILNVKPGTVYCRLKNVKGYPTWNYLSET
jgi:group I intron endonuclease